MRHDFIDRYAYGASVVHRTDARLKIITVITALVGVNLWRTPRWYVFAAAALVAGTVVAAARLPVTYVIKRAVVVLPFAVCAGAFLPFTTAGDAAATWAFGVWTATVTFAGLRLYAAVIAKSYISAAFVLLLVATTPFPDLVAALRWFRAPGLFLDLLAFAYRYLFVLEEEGARLARAWGMRYFGHRPLRRFTVLGPAVASLFVRSYERAERVWGAMRARGYESEGR